MSEDPEKEASLEDVLERDLANIIAKAAIGQPLNLRERKLIEEEVAKKKKLAGDAQAQTAAVAKTGRAANSNFSHDYAYYEKIYATSARTIKRWVLAGKKKNLPTPLDEPAAMPSWWSYVMTQKCPQNVFDAVANAEKNPAASPISANQFIAPAAMNEELGLEGALKRMEQAELVLSVRALEPGQSKPWLDTISRMTATSTKLRQELAAQEKLVSKAEAAAHLRDFHGQISAILKEVLPETAYREVFELLEKEVFE